MMSAMSTWLSAASPPAPMPCTARNAMRVVVSCEKPAAAVASTKMTIASWKSSLRLKRSASLPQTGVEIAVVSSVAVTTQVNADWLPSRSWMITGSEVETTVEASIETNMPSRRPERASSTWRCVILGFGELLGSGGRRGHGDPSGECGWSVGDGSGAKRLIKVNS